MQQSIVTPPITGYRNLSQSEIALINEIKAKAEEVGALLDKLATIQYTVGAFNEIPVGGTVVSRPDQRWLSIARTQLQQGFMAASRAVAQPTTF